MADQTCNCPIVMVALAIPIAAIGLAPGAIYGWLAGALTYVGLWLITIVLLIFRAV